MESTRIDDHRDAGGDTWVLDLDVAADVIVPRGGGTGRDAFVEWLWGTLGECGLAGVFEGAVDAEAVGPKREDGGADAAVGGRVALAGGDADTAHPLLGQGIQAAEDLLPGQGFGQGLVQVFIAEVLGGGREQRRGEEEARLRGGKKAWGGRRRRWCVVFSSLFILPVPAPPSPAGPPLSARPRRRA
jgi:hypothetical protein